MSSREENPVKSDIFEARPNKNARARIDKSLVRTNQNLDSIPYLAHTVALRFILSAKMLKVKVPRYTQ